MMIEQENQADKIISVRHNREMNTRKEKRNMEETRYEIESATRNLEKLFKK